MSRLNMNYLPAAPTGFDRVLATMVTPSGGHFETKEEPFVQDQLHRASRLNKVIFNCPVRQRRARRLGARLAAGTAFEGIPSTLASSRHLRKLRMLFTAAVLQLAEGVEEGVRFLTLVPGGWRLSPGALDRLDITKLMAAVRADLNRAGAGEAGGWMVLVLHGEFDPTNLRYQLHLHGIAYGGMINVINRLRKKPKYRSTKAWRTVDGERVRWRVRMHRKPSTNFLAQATYLLQSFWPARWQPEFPTSPQNRQRKKGRIPEPYHSRWLLKMDRWSLADITLLVGVQVTKAGLTPTRR